jgi:hypothetical protein
MKKIYAFFAILTAISVMFVSITRASLEIIAQEDKEGKLRVETILVELENKDGETETVEYKLPQINMLPNNPFYGFKQLRDQLWVMLTRNKVEKSKIIMILADKKLAETIALRKQGDLNRALDSSEEAVSKLEYAWSLIKDEENNETESLLATIHRATKAYGQVIKGLGEETMDSQKYEKIENKIETFKQKEETSYTE